jgi:ATP-dependent Clp protease adaptor protein ClpS
MGEKKIENKAYQNHLLIPVNQFRGQHEDDPDDGGHGELLGESQIAVKPRHETKLPTFYKVVMLNDDFTPRDFVVHVLQKFFKKEEQEATQIMLQIHHQGSGIAGIFTFEIAETKAYQCNAYAKQSKYPLKCTVEKA